MLIPVVVAVCLVSAWNERPSHDGYLGVVRRGAALLVPLAIGFVLAVLPQAAYYSTRTYDLDSRVRSTSIFRGGWLAAELGLVSGTVALASVVVVVATAGILGVHRHFRDPDQLEVYADPNTEVVDTLARDLVHEAPGTTVYFAGSSRIWYSGFSNFAFRAPLVVGVDVEDPDGFWSDPPVVEGASRFVFLPERQAELAAAVSRYPGGVVTTVTARDGGLLYTEYFVSP